MIMDADPLTAPLPPLPRGPETRVLGVFAHPDDETFFAGGTLATYRERGCSVRLVTLTAGEAGAVGYAAARSAAHDLDPKRIAAAARAGLARYAAACEALGVTDFGPAQPGRWRDLGTDVRAGTLASAPLDDVVRAVHDEITTTRPDVLVTVSPDGVTGHPDHIRTREAVDRALDALSSRGGSLPLTLASYVRRTDVETATTLLGRLTAAVPIGGGGIRGVPDESGPEESRPDESSTDESSADTSTVVVGLSPAAVRAKRRALDVYHRGLGTQPLDALVADADAVGDGVLLRTIAEVAGMDRERFHLTA
jgi:LmbE family N-acetylglucosaminyl deacetylase